MRIRTAMLGVTALVASCVLAPLVASAATPSLKVATRWATPSGTGTVCSQADPCGIVEAINSAPSGADVTIESGIYASKADPLATRLGDMTSSDLTIHGQAGHPFPVIYSAANVGISADNNSTISRVAMHFSGSQYGVITTNQNMDHIISIATSANSHACEFYPTMSDSECIATGAGADAIDLDTSGAAPFTATYAMRGVTAVATGAGSTAVSFRGGAFATVNFKVANSVFEGTVADLKADAYAANAAVNVTLAHSAYRTVAPDTSLGTATVTNGGKNVHQAPKFTSPSNGDYTEKVGSPTIDAGAIAKPAETDVLGNPRTLGKAPDIGAYELAEKPSVGGIKVHKVKKHSAKVTVHVNDEGTSTSLKAVAKHGSHKVKSKNMALPTTNKGTDVTLNLTDLKPHTKYRIHVRAHNSAGADLSKSKTILTK